MAGWLRELNVGDWYQVGTNPPFEIVALDVRSETIEVQYFDGTVAEIDFDSWTELAATPAAPPEDWSGAMDMERDVFMDVSRPSHWDNPLDHVDLYAQ